MTTLRKTLRAYGYVAFVLASAALALWRQFYSDMNSDNAWLLYAAQRFLGGDRLYVDLLEINPPLIIYLNAIVAYAAGIFHVSAMGLFNWAVTALNLGSIYLAAGVIKRHRLYDALPLLRQVSLLFFPIALFVLTPVSYGEREQLLIALILPYLLRSSDETQRLHGARDIIIVLLAALGFALKPFFLLIWAANELFLAIHARSVARLFSRRISSLPPCS